MPATQRFDLGRRIVIWGAAGAGKTTLAQRLGALLDLGVVDLDAIRHANGWESTPFTEFRTQLTGLLDGYTNGWVIAGVYSEIRDVYLTRCDTLIWLHLPWPVAFARLFRRTVYFAWTGERPYPNSPTRQSWRGAMSFLWWSVTHYRSGVRTARERIAGLPPSIRVHELRTAREIDALLEEATLPLSPR
jgi:hypothetical protein